MSTTTDLETLWRAVERAGTVDAYVDEQIRERGFMVERKATDNMSARELKRYREELKKEAAEKKRLRREAWAAYKSKHIVHVGEGIYWNDFDDFDRYDLDDAESRAAENELPKLDKPAQLAEALEISIPTLRWLCYHRDAATSVHYRRFTIPKRDGRERAIWAPLPRIKAAQTWVLRNIVERLPVHGSAHGFLAGRSILTGARHHTGSRLIIKMDVRDFFPTFTFRRVKGLFRHAGYREQVSTLLALLCTEAPREVVGLNGKTHFVSLGPRCLPQGAPTSPAITNAICLRLDRRLAGFAAKAGYRYTRYADDLTFSLPASHRGDPKIRQVLGTVNQIVTDEGMTIHDGKTRISRPGGRQTVTGLVVNGGGPPRVPRDYRRRLRAAIHNLKNGKALREDETLDTLRGMAAYIAMTDPAAGRRFTEALDEAAPAN